LLIHFFTFSYFFFFYFTFIFYMKLVNPFAYSFQQLPGLIFLEFIEKFLYILR
jgi:hypothetical protein